MLAEAISLNLFRNDQTLEKPRAKLISYICDSIKIKRGLDHVSILMVGTTGIGKSLTINHLLNIGAEKKVQFAKTSRTESETRITSEFLAFADDPNLEIKNLVTGIVDTPGFNDTGGLK